MVLTGNSLSIEMGAWPALRDGGFVERLLDTLALPKMTNSQPDTPVWQDAMIQLGDAMRVLKWDDSAEAETILTTVKIRFPLIMASYAHPLACIGTNPLVSPAIICVSFHLARHALNDTSLEAYLQRHSLFEVALLSLLADSPAFPVCTRYILSSVMGCNSLFGTIPTIQRGDLAFPSVVKKFGAANLVQSLDSFLLRPLDASSQLEFLVLLTLSANISRRVFLRPYFLELRTPIKLMQAFWRGLAIFHVDPVDGDADLHWRAFDYLMHQLDFEEEVSRTAALVFELVRTCDLTTFLARIMASDGLATRDVSSSALIPELLDFLVLYCQHATDSELALIRPNLLPSLEYFRDQDTSKYPRMREVVAGWTRLVGACNTTEQESGSLGRGEEVKDLGLIGCSWLHCIFHGGEREGSVGRRMLLDNRCLAVQYCSFACQKRDWHHGGHGLACHGLL